VQSTANRCEGGICRRRVAAYSAISSPSDSKTELSLDKAVAVYRAVSSDSSGDLYIDIDRSARGPSSREQLVASSKL
jgi:hypothetical protein